MQLEKSTFQFLKDLQKNNNRDWFEEHKPTYVKAQQNAKAVFAAINEKLTAHDEIEKSKMMRIYRDVRFSHDKTPYKAHFANSYSRLGKELRGGYFLRIRPGESFLAGGFWEPNKDDLFRIRKEIEQDASEIRGITEDKNYITLIGISEFYRRLDSNKFCRIHRSFVVNKSKISSYKNSCIKIGEVLLPVGKSYRESLSEL